MTKSMCSTVLSMVHAVVCAQNSQEVTTTQQAQCDAERQVYTRSTATYSQTGRTMADARVHVIGECRTVADAYTVVLVTYC